MSRANGQLRTCDRCGKTIFLKTTGEGERDGGFTRWNTFEEATDWTNEYEVGDLCPECSELLKILKQNFKREVEKFKNEVKKHE